MDYKLATGTFQNFEKTVKILLEKGYMPIASVQVNELQQGKEKGQIIFSLSMIKKDTTK